MNAPQSGAQSTATTFQSLESRECIVLIVGDELLEGKRVDRHAAYLTRILGEYDLSCRRVEFLRDHRAALAEAASRALSQTRLLFVTGGLGPTVDDITREALSDATGIALRENPNALAMIESRFRAFNRPMTPNNRNQALVPERGGFFVNDNGTAPGLYFESDRGLIIALPGPPRELEPMFDQQVIPFLRERGFLGARRYSRVLRFACMGESNVDQVVRNQLGGANHVRVSLLARLGLVDLTLIQEGTDPAGGQQLDEAIGRIQRQLGEFVYTDDNTSLEAVVGRLLSERGETVAVAESCTGGLLGALLTEVPGSSNYFLGGVIAYHNQVKERLLGVEPAVLDEHGAVSRKVAEQMAMGVIGSLGTDWGLAVTGVAGPSGGSVEKPIGTVWIAVANASGAIHAFKTNFAGDRSAIRQRAAIFAFDQLRRALHLLPLHD